MKNLVKYFYIFSLSILLFSSCVPQRRLVYLQEKVDNITTYNIPNSGETRIKPNDELYINVSSFDDVSFNFFGTQGAISGMALTSDLSIALRTYTVNTSGKIFFPILGEIDVLDLTPEEASIKLKDQLASYFDQPIVTVKFGFKKITVLGEVSRPGYYTYSKDQLTLLEAIGMAGDLTLHANRKEVILIRNKDSKVEKRVIDLTHDQLVFNDAYFLQPDDILYIKPRKSVKWTTTATPLALIISSITASILLISTVLDNT